MNKKSGTAGSPVAPMQPIEAQAADLADPGAMAKIKAEERQRGTGKYGSTPAKSSQPLEPESAEEKAKKKHWLEVELVDQDGDPLPGEAYRIILPDGETPVEGTLDEKGFVRLDGLDAGSCQVSFPNLDKTSWKPE
jgi:type VI secretion system secreted protein VgrG